MELELYLRELDRLQEEGAFVFIKWDGERTENSKTVLIERPGTDYRFRRDTDDLLGAIKAGVADYDETFNKGI